MYKTNKYKTVNRFIFIIITKKVLGDFFLDNPKLARLGRRWTRSTIQRTFIACTIGEGNSWLL